MPIRLTEERDCVVCNEVTIHVNMICKTCGNKALFSWQRNPTQEPQNLDDGRQIDETDLIDAYIEEKRDLWASRTEEMYE